MTREVLFTVTLADCDVQTFTVSGAGGQHRDRAQTGVRVVHKASGAVGQGRESRSQMHNKRDAFVRMTQDPRFRFWLREEKKRLETGKTTEERVEEMMQPPFLKVEVKVDGKWTESVE